MITPLPLGEGKGEGPLLALNAVCSVHLCYSVRNRMHPLDEIMPMRLAGEFFLSRWGDFSLTELTDLTEPFCTLFRFHRRPPAYRVHRTL